MTPKYYEFYLPILKVLTDLEKKDINTIIQEVVEVAGLSSEDKKETTRSGNRLRFRSNISWALTDLTQGGFIERIDRGVYMITIKGLELLEENPINPTRDTLASKSQKFRDFLNRQRPKAEEKLYSNDLWKDTSLDPSLSSISKEDGEVSTISIDESDTVSIEELYHTLAILKKAKLSTKEIEEKIHQVEKTSTVKRNIKQLVDVLENLCQNLNSNDIINIEFKSQKSISIKNRSFHYTISLPSLERLQGMQKEEDFVENSNFEKTHLHNPRAINTNLPSVSIPKAQKEESDRPNPDFLEESHLPKGVWIKPYSDKTFVLYGNTSQFTELLKSYGGKFYTNLSEGDGWIFMNGKKEGLEKDLKHHIISSPNLSKKPYGNNSKVRTITTVQERKIIDNLSESQRELLMKYKAKLTNLRSFSFLGITGPHKAVLLLSIFYLIKEKTITTPKIYFTEELESQYNTYWQQLFGTSPSLGAAYPFAHLSNDSFLTHKLIRPLADYNITWNRQILKKYIPYTMIEKPFFNILTHMECNKVLGRFLITHYCESPKVKTEEGSFDRSNSNKIGFQNYLSKALAKRGRVLADSTITGYMSALSSQYLKNKIEYFHHSGDIYEVEDLELLKNLALIVEEDVRFQRSNPTNRLALNLYIKYLAEGYS